MLGTTYWTTLLTTRAIKILQKWAEPQWRLPHFSLLRTTDNFICKQNNSSSLNWVKFKLLWRDLLRRLASTPRCGRWWCWCQSSGDPLFQEFYVHRVGVHTSRMWHQRVVRGRNIGNLSPSISFGKDQLPTRCYNDDDDPTPSLRLVLVLVSFFLLK